MCLANMSAIATRFEVPATFFWTNEWDVAHIAHPEILFDRNLMNSSGISFKKYHEVFVTSGPMKIHSDSYKNRISHNDFLGVDAALISCSHFQFFEGESYINTRRLLCEAFSKIHPSAEVAARIAGFPSREDLRSAIGVHVRRGDICKSEKLVELSRIVDVNIYFQAIDIVRMRDDSPIFLCTEDKGVRDAFSQRYGDCIISFPTRSVDRLNPTSCADAFAEMYLLSETRLVIGATSAFNRVAAGRGLVPLFHIANETMQGDSTSLSRAALEFMQFGMLDEAAQLIQRCATMVPSDHLEMARTRLKNLTSRRERQPHVAVPSLGAS